jgi:hypothetical protein
MLNIKEISKRSNTRRILVKKIRFVFRLKTTLKIERKKVLLNFAGQGYKGK